MEYEEKIRRSIFKVTLAPVTNIDEAKEFIAAVSLKYRTASHNCWAYIVGYKGEVFHASDAGEPSGTAGKPILNALQKNNLSNIAVVVTRYFGGVKLGVRGLIDAYGMTVEKCVEQAELVKLVKMKVYHLQTSYDFLDILKYNLKNLQVKIGDIHYTDVIKLELSIEEDYSEPVEIYIEEMQNSGKLIKTISE